MTQQGPDYGQFQVGGVVQPLSTGSGNSLLRDADPALYYALDFWQWVINNHPGPRLVQACAAAGVKDIGGQAITSACAQAYPYEPLPQQLETHFRFPLLAAWRTVFSQEWISVGWEIDASAVSVLYVLPPLSAAQTEQVLPIFNAIKQALRRKTTDAWDPAYTPPGGNAGDQFTALPYGATLEAGFGVYGGFGGRSRSLSRMGEQGWYQSDKGLFFPCLRLDAYLVERDMYNPTQNGPSKFAGADITANVAAPDGTSVAFVQVATQGPPTITGLSVSTGPAAGGTAVTVSGTNFLSGPPLVYFGPGTDPQYAQSVTYVSATQLTVTTPVMSGSGTVALTVQNRDGQSATLPGAFTFT